MALLAGCATPPPLPPLSVPLPSRDLLLAHAGNYKNFVFAWTGSMRTRTFDGLLTAPSDARLLPVSDTDKGMERQRRVILTAFSEWCEQSKGVAWPRSEDMISPGRTFAVCELKASGDKIAALRVLPSAEAPGAGRPELLVEHWYAPDIALYVQAWRSMVEQKALLEKKALAERAAQEQEARRKRKAAEKTTLESMAAAARFRSPTACQRFERASNALLARFTVALQRADLQRHTSDLAVALDECTSSRNPPPDALAEIYRFNIQSFQLLANVWEAGLMPACPLRITCDIQHMSSSTMELHRIGELQSRYPALHWLSNPERIADITGRVFTFVPDR